MFTKKNFAQKIDDFWPFYKIWTVLSERDFVTLRQTGLQKYLDLLLADPELSRSWAVRKFLNPPVYAIDFQGNIIPNNVATKPSPFNLALNKQSVHLNLRNRANFEVGNLIPDVGWRLKKDYFRVKCRSDPKTDRILTWTDFGPDSTSSDVLEPKTFQSLAKSLQQMEVYYYAYKMDIFKDQFWFYLK